MKRIICVDKEKNPYSIPVSELNWRPSIYGIIIRDNNILLLPQWDGYDLPGGGIDLGEDFAEALTREIKEETGYDTKIGELIDAKTSFFHTESGKNPYIQSVMLYFQAEIIGGELSTAGFDEEEKLFCRMAEWIPIERVGDIPYKSSVDVLTIIQRALKKQ